MKNELTPQILAMYLGQKCTSKWIETGEENEWPISTITISQFSFGLVEITPHLRRLDSLTESEARELHTIATWEEWNYEYNSYAANRDRGMGKIWSCLQNWWAGDYEMFAENGNWLVGDPNAWLYLLSKGFDLFGGIEAGWAKEIETKITV